MKQQTESSPFFRWLLFLPVAAIAAWLAWLAVSIGNKLTMGSQGIEATSFLPRLFIEFYSHAAMGAAFVFAGAKVAPTQNKSVAYGLSALALVAGGFLLFPAFWMADYWAVWGGVSFIFGAGAIAYGVNLGQVDF